MSKLELILLGQFECLLPSGTRISLSMRKAEVLLAYLALTPGLRHPRERLINLLWSDRSEEQARNSLRQCLSAIRKSLGDVADMVLQVDRTTVTLVPELIDIDVHEFERLAAEGDYESLTTAADLYQGEFLEGISIRDASCQEWLDSERGRFKRQFIEILSELAETQLLSHDFGNAIKSTERLVKQDPLGESGWRLLMRAYFDNGDRSHALQAFKRCQQALREELDVEPETATLELRDRFASGEAKPAPSPIPIAKKSPADSAASTDHSIAVLPFDNLSGDPEQEYFSDGITESIILNLSLFPGLNVKSRNSSFAFKQQIKSIGEISNELGVDYVVEGSIRRSSDRIRITVQLIEAASGNQVWGKRYDAKIDDLFDLEEELSRTIAATITGQIESDLQRIALAKGAAHQQAYDLLLQGTYLLHRSTAEDTAKGIASLYQCLDSDPDNVRAHGTLYCCHSLNWMERWLEDYEPSFELAGKHAAKAVALDPENGLANYAFGEFMMFSRNYEEADKYFDKALAINPNDPDALTAKAVNLQMQGHLDAAYDLAQKACQLDPYSWWTDWNLAEAQYLNGHYQDAIETIENSKNAPGFIKVYAIASHVKLGNLDVARKVLQEFLSERRNSMTAFPTTREDWLRYSTDTAPFVDQGINRGIVECLMQAGLDEELSTVAVPGVGNELPSIAVLPFENMSGDPEQEYFSDGITTDLIATLSKFRHLRTVSHYSTQQYKTEKPPLAEIAAQQQARYILEGSVRKSGNRIRVSAELIDSHDESLCWSERYDHDLDDLFALQDQITHNIGLAMKVQLDDGGMANIRSRGTTNIRAWELIMTATDLQDTYIRQNILDARAMADEAIQLDPNYAYAWLTLAWTHWQECYICGGKSIDTSIDAAEKANQHARSLDSDYAEVWSQAGLNHLMRHDAEAALESCRKAVELEPGSAEINALMAFACIFSGDYELALKYNQNIRKLCPVMANWYFLIEAQIEKIAGNFDNAAALYRQGLEIEPDSPLCRFYLVDVMMDKGDQASAQLYADEIRALDNTVRGNGLVHSFSIDPVLRERFAANLAKFDLI